MAGGPARPLVLRSPRPTDAPGLIPPATPPIVDPACHIRSARGAVETWTSFGREARRPRRPSRRLDEALRRRSGREEGTRGGVGSRCGAVRADLAESSAATISGSSASPPGCWAPGTRRRTSPRRCSCPSAARRCPRGEAGGWLSVAAAHTALNLLRSGRRRTAREEAAAGDDAVVPDVAEAVVTLEERSRVRAALARLPRKQAVALVLRHSGLSYAEVAAALDLSPGSVGTTVRRAESALRKELNRHASSD